MKLTILQKCFFCLCLTACGDKPITVAEPIKPWFALWTQETGIDTDGVGADFGNIRNGQVDGILAIGLTDMSTHQITFDTAYWAQADDLEKENLVFHELGHARLGLEHVTKIGLDGCPVTLMYPGDIADPYYVQFAGCYVRDHAIYIDVLKSFYFINLSP